MFSSLLLTLALLAPAAAASPQRARTRAPQVDRAVVSPAGQVLGTEADFDLAVGGRFSNPFSALTSVSALPNRVFRITLSSTGTGWEESFLIGIPRTPVVPFAPLLVAFHSYGRLPENVVDETTYFQEAMERGWFVVAPTGAHKFNFGIDYAQENIRVVLDWIQTYLPINHDRVYGVGFSMGGGGATCYAARHLDPRELMFAGLVNHTGTVSIRDDYEHALDTSLYEHPLMFGGSPSENPFGYQRASTIDLNSATGIVDPNSDLVRNLVHVPTSVFAVMNDPLMHLVGQALHFHDQLLLRGGDSDLNLQAGNVHAWSTLDETAVLDFLAPLHLAPSQPGATREILADRDGRYLQFDIQQAVSGTFTPFRFNVQQASNRLFFDRASNLAALSFDPAELQLDRHQNLSLILSTAGGTPLAIQLRGYQQPPSQVLRNGVVVSNWTYDSLSGSVSFTESAPDRYPNWVVVP